MVRLAPMTLLLLGAMLPSGLASQTPADLAHAVQVRDRAIESYNVASWERFTAADFTVVDGRGRLLTRAEQRAELAGDRNYQLAGQPLIYVDGIRVRSGSEPGESGACTSSTVVLQGAGDWAVRRCSTGTGSKLELWTKTGSGWKAIAAQYTPTA